MTGGCRTGCSCADSFMLCRLATPCLRRSGHYLALLPLQALEYLHRSGVIHGDVKPVSQPEAAHLLQLLLPAVSQLASHEEV
jgi:hypothetical protein